MRPGNRVGHAGRPEVDRNRLRRRPDGRTRRRAAARVGEVGPRRVRDVHAQRSRAAWNGPPAALMSYGALPLVGSTTRIVTLGNWPGAVLVTLRTSYLNFARGHLLRDLVRPLDAQVRHLCIRAVAGRAGVVGRGDAAVVGARGEVDVVVARGAGRPVDGECASCSPAACRRRSPRGRSCSCACPAGTRRRCSRANSFL